MLFRSLKAAWGYAAVIETGGTTLLFDTGGDGPTLMSNLRVLGLDPRAFDAVVLSHNHADHTGGLEAVVSANANHRLAVYAPSAFSAPIKARLGKRARVIEVGGSARIAEHLQIIGNLGGTIAEQALAVQAGAGLAVVTGCAHPGIVAVVRRALSLGDVRMIAGGFHLKDKGQSELETIIASLKQLGVRRVAPSHCTGDQAIRMLEEAFGPGFVQAGVGATISLSDPPVTPQP